MLSDLLSILNGKWLANRQMEIGETKENYSSMIRINTTRLPRAFREKFRLGGRGIKQDEVSIAADGTYKIAHIRDNSEKFLPNGVIDESEGDIKIMCFNLEIHDRTALMEAINGGKKRKNNIEIFLENFTKKQPLSEDSDRKFVMYLEVGGGVYWHSELFEKLIIARDGKIEKSLVCGENKIKNIEKRFDQSTFPLINFETKMKNIGAELLNAVRAIGDYFKSDDGNIQYELQTNRNFCDAFYNGKAKIIVYHRVVQSLTLLCFEEHDKRVAAIDRKRHFFVKSKNVTGFVVCMLISYAALPLFNSIPLVGQYLGVVCRFIATVTAGIALYKVCQLLPEQWQVRMRSFINQKIIPHLPLRKKGDDK
ncbi:MAG: hypothetical protein LBR92_03835 [Puniceicoccales bacterium]|jgi:hypothetical protein|nr:hypothetical protein [Puniceicoccales bacterium]